MKDPKTVGQKVLNLMMEMCDLEPAKIFMAHGGDVAVSRERLLSIVNETGKSE